MEEEIARALRGRWRKVEPSDPCADLYPDQIEFSDLGIYRGRKGSTGGGFTL